MTLVNIKRGMALTALVAVCSVATARPHHHFRHAPKAKTTVVVVNKTPVVVVKPKPVVVKKKSPKVVKKVVIIRK